MNLWQQISIFIASGIVLTVAASVVVKQSSILARKLGLSSFVIGFLFLGLVTSTPELFVAMQAARDGIPQLAVGNLLGGSILLLSFVMGMTAIFLGRVRLDHQLAWREILVMLAVIAAPIAVLWDTSLTRQEGLFLVGVYIIHAFILNRDNKKNHKKGKPLGKGLGRHIFMLAVGMGTMFLSSRFIVTSAEAIMAMFSIAPILFGLFFLSLGTNLPEMALAYESIRHRRREIAFGDFLGSSAANTLILGLLGLVAPFAGAGNGRLPGALLILGSVTVYFLWAISSGRTITRKEGIGLLAFYLLFVLYEVL